MSLASVALMLPPSIRQTMVEPGPSPTAQVGTEQRGVYRGWLGFIAVHPGDDGVLNLRNLVNTGALDADDGLLCTNRSANRALNWQQTTNPSVFGTIDAVIIAADGLAALGEHQLAACEDSFELSSLAGGITQYTRLGLGSLGASPRDIFAIVGGTAPLAAANKAGSSAVVCATLPKPVVVDYNGAAFTLTFPRSGLGFPSAANVPTVFVMLHGTWGTKGAGAGTVINGCDTEGAPTADDVAASSIKTATLLAMQSGK